MRSVGGLAKNPINIVVKLDGVIEENDSIQMNSDIYFNGDVALKPANSYIITTVSAGQNLFSSWQVSGNLSLADATASSTILTVFGSGTLTLNMHTVLFWDGFEVPFSQKWNAYGDWNRITDPVHHGSYSAQSDVEAAWLSKILAEQSAAIYVRFYYQIKGTVPTTTENHLVAEIYDGGVYLLAVYIRTGASGPYFRLTTGTPFDWGTFADTGPISVDQFYCLEIYLQAGSASADANIYINDVDSAHITLNTSGRKPDNFLLYSAVYSAPYTGKSVFDCVIADNARIYSTYHPEIGV